MDYGEYTLEPIEKEDAFGIAQLQKHLWGEDLTENEDHLNWKYFENPFTDHPMAYVAKKEDRIVGFMGLMPSFWNHGDEVLKFLSFGDGCIHPDHRRKGLYTNLIKTMVDGLRSSEYQGYLNLSSNELMTPVLERIGWKPLVERSYLKRISYINYLLRSKEKGSSSSSSNGIIKSKGPKVADLIRCNNGNRDKDKIQLLIDKEFLKWRFSSKRRDYDFYYRYDGNRLTGYIIALMNKQGTGRIIDFSYENLQIFKELLDEVITNRSIGLLMMMNVNFGSAMRGILKSKGFKDELLINRIRKRTDSCNISYNPIKDNTLEGGCRIIDINNWDIKEIASDGV